MAVILFIIIIFLALVPPSPKQGPSTASEPQDRRKKRKRYASKPLSPPVAKQQVVAMATPDVGEERLDHMKKMRELKTLLPDLEMQYYRNLVSKIVINANF